MSRYFIENAKCGVTEGGMGCGPISGNVVATIQFKEGNATQWLSLVEVEGIPNVYLTEKDVFEDLVAEDFEDTEFIEYMQEHYIDEFEGIEFDDDYSSTFESITECPENPAVPLIRFLIALIRCEMDEVNELIELATGRYVDEIDIPVSDVEEEWIDEDYNEDEDSFSFELPEDIDVETLYRLRLSMETDIKTESVFHDMDDEGLEQEEKRLLIIKEKCDDEEYLSWVNAFISAEFEKIKDVKFIVCTYLFAGIGQYDIIIPEDQKESFICWINGNGSAFYGGDREATEEEIKTFIALHAADGLQEE